MSKVRVLVGTHKGAFILNSDAKRQKWSVDGPFFGGLDIYHVKGSPANPDRIYASQASDWFGQVVHRSDDGGKTWQAVGNEFNYAGQTSDHKWYDDTPHPWEFKRVWHFEPDPVEPDTVYAGVEDAALFKSTDGGVTWAELPGLRTHRTAGEWHPGAGGLCLHTILIDPNNNQRIFVAISAAGVFRSEDGGQTWKIITKGLSSNHMPDEEFEVGHCVHRIAMHPAQPNVLYMQKHWDVLRSDNSGDLWYEVSGNLPSDFGFVVDVNSNDPETFYVIPIKSDSEHYPPEGKLRVYRSKGGEKWEALTKGLPQENVYVNVLRDALCVDKLNPCGLYFGTTGGQVYGSSDEGDSWQPIVEHLPSVLSVEVQTID